MNFLLVKNFAHENFYLHKIFLYIYLTILVNQANASYKLVPNKVAKNDHSNGEVQASLPTLIGLSHEAAKDWVDTQSKHIRRDKRGQTKRHQPKRYTDSATQDDNIVESQSFLHSFAPFFPSPHSRPLLYPEHSFRNQYKNAAATFREIPVNADNLLGSGNYGVIKGGTYYAGENDNSDITVDDFYAGNSHSRPPYGKRNPSPAYRNGGDFFANFRDFADITAPTKTAFSEYYLVYAPKPGAPKNGEAAEGTRNAPRNIIEQLNSLGSLEAMEDNDDKNGASKKSKFKQKLEKHMGRIRAKEDSSKAASAKKVWQSEPLIALS